MLKDSLTSLWKHFSQKVSRSFSIAWPENDIIIFSEGAAYWYTFKPIVEELIERKISFCYCTLDKNDPGLFIQASGCAPYYLGSGAIGLAKFGMLKAKILLTTTPNIGCKGFPLAKPKNVECLAHVFHSISDIATYRKHSLDHYDAVLMVGDFALRSIRETEELRGLKAKECVSVGAPYFDVLLAMADPKRKKSADANKTVLLAPSWGRKGFLSIYGTKFITELAKLDLNFIFRPHPHSFKSEKRLLEDVEKIAASSQNIRFDCEPDCGPAMAESDILISDSSSIRFDYAFIYQRPIITLRIPPTDYEEFEYADLGFKWEDELEPKMGTVFSPTDCGAIAEKITDALLNPETYRTLDLLEARERYVAHLGKSGKAVVDWIHLTCTT